MADILNSAASWLAAQLKSHVSQSVTYRRGQLRLAGLAATLGATRFEVSDAGGGLHQHEVRTFRITRADLILAGEVTLPRKGDRIELADGSVFQVSAPAGADVFEFTDPHEIGVRIHATLVST